MMPNWFTGKGSGGVNYCSKQGDILYVFVISSEGSYLVNERQHFCLVHHRDKTLLTQQL